MKDDDYIFSSKDFKNFLKPFTTIKAILIIIISGFIVFSHGFFNGFVGDDLTLIRVNPYVHSITNITHFFTNGAFYFPDGNPQGNNYYKPLLGTSYSLIYTFFGENQFAFHFFQILLSIINGVLLFLILKSIFKEEFAFLLTLIFLVHPINLEPAIYIAALQDTLYMLFGLLALYITIKNVNRKLTLYLIPILLLFSLLSKETGVLFLIIIPFFNFLFIKRNLILNIVQSGTAFSIYLFLRLGIAHIGVNKSNVVPIMDLTLVQRLINIPKIVFYYLQNFIFPNNLQTSQVWVVKDLSLQDFWIPLTVDFIFFSLLLSIGYLIHKKTKEYKKYLFFLIWFLIGLGLHIQIIPLDETVSTRWFYFPIIGLFGMIGVTISALWTFKNKNAMKLGLLIILAILVLFSIRTMARSADWQDNFTLVNTDFKTNPDSFQIITGLALIAGSEGKVTEAEHYFIQATNVYPSTHTYSQLANFYIKTNQFEKAKAALETGFNYGEYFELDSYYTYTLFILGDNESADKFLDNSLKKYPNSFLFWTYKAVAKHKLGDKAAATQAIGKAYQINPDETTRLFLLAIQNDQTLNFTLNPGE